MPLIYSFIARDGVILAEYMPFSGNFNTIALEVLQHLKNPDKKFTILADRHTFNFIVANGLTYLVVADEAYGREIPFAFLARVQAEFQEKYPLEGQTGTGNSLDRAFGPRLKAHAEYCMKHPEQFSKVAAAQEKVKQVKNVMLQNIEKVMERGEKIEVLVDKTEGLQSTAKEFQKKGKQLRRAMWWQNCRMKLCVLAVVIILAVVIFAVVCFYGGNNCVKTGRIPVPGFTPSPSPPVPPPSPQPPEPPQPPTYGGP